MKHQLHLPVSICLILLLMAFQCGRKTWTKYARDWIVQVNPKEINLFNDTLRCQILVDGRAKMLKPGEAVTLEFYARGEQLQKVGEVTLPPSQLVEVDIHQILELKTPVAYLEVRSNHYNSGKIKSVSPNLMIATINDRR